jgi:hypothetical protein
MARAFRAVLAATLAATALYFAPVSTVDAALPSLDEPTWAQLSQNQRQILAPLANDWDKLEPYRRKKWIGIAQRYPQMHADEQQRVQRNMKYWANLTPEERKAVREKYKKMQKAPPEQRQVMKQKWQEYKDLPEDEKLRLREAAAKRKPTPKSAAGQHPPILAPRNGPSTLSPGTQSIVAPATANAPPSAVAGPALVAPKPPSGQ